mgnify:FL=1
MENNINEDQPISVPDQETPIQVQEIPSEEVIPEKTREKPKGKKVIIVFLILLVLISIAVVAYVFIIKPKSKNVEPVVTDKNISSTTSAVPQNNTVTTESPFGKLTEEICNNMECLIEAVKKCEPVTVTISYSNESNQLLLSMKIFNEMVFSGKTIYEVKNTDEKNICSISISTPVAVAKFTEESEKELMDLGATEKDIADSLKPINDSLSLIEVAQSKKVCTGKGNELAELLSDSQKENLKVEVTNGEILYTTLSGKSIKCYIQSPPKQKANSGLQITADECESKSGLRRFVVDGEEACYVGETDLGRVIFDNISTAPNLQCCVSN